MANGKTERTSFILEDTEVDESRENIPPAVTAAAGTRLKVQVGDVVGYSAAHPSGENKPLSNSYTFSTPTPTNTNGGTKAKSRLSGLQSALTPILKYLNIANKCPSPEPVKCGNSPHLNVPSFSFGVTTANCQKSTGASDHHPNSEFSGSHSGRSVGDKDATVRWLNDEYLPEITLLDVTCDSTMQMTRNDSALPDSVPATPVKALNSTFSTLQPSKLSSSAPIPCPQNKTVDPLQSNVGSLKAEGEATDQVGSLSKITAETSLVMNQSTGGSCHAQDTTVDNDPVKKSGGAASLTTFHQNDNFDSKSSCEQNGTITLSETSSSHQNTLDQLSLPKARVVPTITKENCSEVHPPKLSKHNGTTAHTDPGARMVDTPERANAPLRWLDDRFFPEITLLDITHDSELSQGAEVSPMDVTQDIPLVDSVKNSRPSSELSEPIMAEPGRLDTIQSEELSGAVTGNVTHTTSSFSKQSDRSVGENTKSSLEVTQDISMGSVFKNSSSSSEPSGPNIVKSQTPAGATVGVNSANVIHDINSSSDVSGQCAASQSSSSDMQRNTKNVASELHAQPLETCNTAEANNEERLTSHDAELTDKVPQLSPKRAGSTNDTFTIVQPSNMSASADLNTTNQISCPQNKTLELPSPSMNSPKAESGATDQVSADFKSSTETSLVTTHNSSASKTGGSCDAQNATFDRHSFQKSGGSTNLGEAGAATFCLQSISFDGKPPSKQNGTITLSETSSSDGRHSAMDKPSPTKFCNQSPKDKNTEVPALELSKQNGTINCAEPNAKTAGTTESTLETNPAAAVAPEAGRHESKDHSQSCISVTDGLSDSLAHQGVTKAQQASTFVLDDTLDLRVDSLVTSTPMTSSKVFQFSTEHEEGKAIAAQKKLYGDGPSKPLGQVPSDVPSNIVSDRKTFLTQPAAKSLLPPSKVTSQLLRYKPAAALPGRREPLTSGLPMTRQRTQAEASDAAQGTKGTSSSYNLRATTTGSKQPNSALPRPQLSGMPSGIQRPAPGLRPPSTRSNTQASSSTDKVCGPTAPNPVAKTSQAKKHHLRGEALPTAKRKKIDAPLASGDAEAPTSSCDKAKSLKQPTANQRALPAKTQRNDAAVPASTAEASTSCDAASRARALKQPANSHRAQLAKPHGHGCAKCVALEEQLKMKSEEIRRLKEELLKYRKQGEES